MVYIILVTHILASSALLFLLVQLLFIKLFEPRQIFLTVIFLAMYQLLSGFTMISLKHYDFTEVWIIGSVIGFIVFILSWLIFVFRPFSIVMLILSNLTLLTMVFLMTNKIA